MIAADVAERNMLQDAVILEYVQRRNVVNWTEFKESFERDRAYIRERLCHLADERHVSHSTGPDGYSESTETWSIAPAGYARIEELKGLLGDNYERIIRTWKKERASSRAQEISGNL